MELIKRIAEWQANPKRTYEEGVALLKEAVKKWRVNPLFDRRQDWPKLAYELGKVNPEGVPDSEGQVVVDNAELKEPSETKLVKAENPGAEIKTAEPVDGPVNIVGKIDREKLTPEQQAKYDKYLEEYDRAIAMHEDLKRVDNDDERKNINVLLVQQDLLCGKLWEELENSINGIEEPAKEAPAEKTAAELAFEAGKKIKLLKNNIARIKKEIKDKELTGPAKTKKLKSIKEKQGELDDLIAKYGE